MSSYLASSCHRENRLETGSCMRSNMALIRLRSAGVVFVIWFFSLFPPRASLTPDLGPDVGGLENRASQRTVHALRTSTATGGRTTAPGFSVVGELFRIHTPRSPASRLVFTEGPHDGEIGRASCRERAS